MSIKDLFVTIGVKADIGQLNKIDSGINRISSSMRSLGYIAMSSTMGLGALAMVIKKTTEMGEAIDKSSQKFGIGTDALQGIQYAAYQADIPIEMLDISFKKMSMTLKQLGRTNITTESAFMQLADRFAQMKDGPEKAALAVKWFGRAGTELIPLMNQGSEAIRKQMEYAKQLGYIMGEEDIAASNKFQTQYKVLMGLMRGLRILITSSVLPAITKYTDSLIKYVTANKEIIKTRIVEFFKTLVSVMKVLLGVVVVVWKAFKFFSTIVGGVDNAVKILIGSFLLFHALKIASGVYSIITGFIGLTTAIGGTNIALGIMNVLLSPITLTVLLITSALAGLFLIIEDLYVYFKGGDSVFGSGLDTLLAKFGKLGIIVRAVRAGLDNIVWLLNKIPGVDIKVGENELNTAIGNANEIIGKNPKSSPVTKNQNIGGTVVNMSSPISVNVAGTADPEKTASMTYSAVKDSIDQILREAQRAVAPVAD